MASVAWRCNDGRAAKIVGNVTLAYGLSERTITTRVMSGAIVLRICSHFGASVRSNELNSVILPPGCAMLAKNPAATGSVSLTNTVGTVILARTKADVAVPPTDKITSVSIRKHFESFESLVIQSGDLIREGHHRCGRRRTADVTTGAN